MNDRPNTTDLKNEQNIVNSKYMIGHFVWTFLHH